MIDQPETAWQGIEPRVAFCSIEIKSDVTIVTLNELLASDSIILGWHLASSPFMNVRLLARGLALGTFSTAIAGFLPTLLRFPLLVKDLKMEIECSVRQVVVVGFIYGKANLDSEPAATSSKD